MIKTKLSQKVKTSLVLLLAALTTTSVLANRHQHLCDFAPKNNLFIPVGLKSSGGISEQQFNAVIDQVAAVYEPIVKEKGATLKVNRDWEDGEVNASAYQFEQEFNLNLYGGLARHELMTQDTYAMIICHELGHHLGGAPKYIRSKWASTEGQSDYFAATKCFRRVFEKDDNASVVAKLNVPQLVKDKCSTGFKSETEINLCIRSVMASENVARLLHALRKGTEENLPKIEKQDPEVVSETYEFHPIPQCRLDTLVAGSICPVSALEDFSNQDVLPGSCAQEKNDAYGYRPLCWYKPKSTVL